MQDAAVVAAVLIDPSKKGPFLYPGGLSQCHFEGGGHGSTQEEPDGAPRQVPQRRGCRPSLVSRREASLE